MTFFVSYLGVYDIDMKALCVHYANNEVQCSYIIVVADIWGQPVSDSVMCNNIDPMQLHTGWYEPPTVTSRHYGYNVDLTETSNYNQCLNSASSMI